MIPGGSRGVVESACRWRAEGAALALVVVARTEGSTYRKAGALAAVAADGRRAGVISGGCLESSVDELAARAIAAREPLSLALDTRRGDDAIFGSGSGCRGRMEIVALPSMRDGELPALDAVVDAWARGATAVLSWSELAPRLDVGDVVRVAPPPALLLLGAGPEAPPVLSLARALGWRAIVGDHRPALLRADRLEGADRVIEGRPRAVLEALAGEGLDAALVMTHGAEADLEALAALASCDVPRVGLLGPPARRDELLARLDPRSRDALRFRLRAPAGLRLGGDGPEAIALAVVAELQRELHGAP